MSFFEYPQSELAFFSETKNLEGEKLSMPIFDRAGVFVVRKLIALDSAQKYLKRYECGISDGSVKPRQNHITEVSFELDHPLAKILFEPGISSLLSNFFEGKTGLHNIRIIRKDHQNTEPVFVHQDSPYCLGFFDRFSMFVALTPCSAGNGGLFVYPGTHHFGYLGDAGALREDLTNQLIKVTPTLEPGDCLIMHSAIWHGSSRNDSSTSRVLYDVQIQPVNDPSSLISLCDHPLSPWRLRLDNEEIFSNSRVQRVAGVKK